MGHERSSTTLDLYSRRTDNPERILEALSDPDDDPDGGAAGSRPRCEADAPEKLRVATPGTTKAQVLGSCWSF
jgi:hypothetical protein